MTSLETVKPRRSVLAKLAAGSLLAVGLMAVSVAPASADDDDWHGKKHWKHSQGHWDGYGNGYGYGYGHHKHKHRKPKVVYYAPPPVYYAPPPPVYYQPAPVYYQPAPVYYYPDRPRVSVDLVFPIKID